MAVPVFEGSQGGYSNIATTSHSASLDATASAGDLLLVLAASASNGITISASGFTMIDGGTIDDGGPTGEYVALWKLATGGETSVSISTSSSTTLSYCVLRFSNAEYASKSTTSFGTSTAPNSTTPTSPSTGENFFQVSAAFWHGGTYQTGYPTNYTTGQTESNDSFDAGTVSDGVAAACRSVASTEDPGAFTLNDSVGWAAQTYTVISDDGGTTHTITGNDIQSDTSTSDGTITQDHQIAGGGIRAESSTSDNTLSQDHQIAGGGIAAGSSTSDGAVSQDHQITGGGIASGTSTSDGTISENSSIAGGSIAAATSTSDGTITQDHQIVGGHIASGSSTSSGMASEDTLVMGLNIVSGSSTSAGTITQDHQITGLNIASGSSSQSVSFSQLHFIASSGTGLASGSSTAASGTVAINSAGPKHCCCIEEGCDVQDDNFNRDDSDSLGSKWIEVSGDGDIVSNRLVVYSGITLTTARQMAPILPGHDYAHSLTVRLMRSDGTNSYSSWRIILNWMDSSNYSFLDVTYNAGTGEWWPAFYNVAGGGSPALVMDVTTHPRSIPFSTDPDGNLHVQICYAEVEWSISDLKSQTQWTTCEANPVATLPSNPSHGLVGFGPGCYDDFDYNVHYESRRECPPCQCFCLRTASDMSCIPEVLTLTLVPVGGAYSGGYSPCPTPSNLVFTMRQVVPIFGSTSGPSGSPVGEPTPPTLTPNRETADKRVWHSPLITGDTGSAVINGRYHRITLVCDSDRDRLYLLVQQNPYNDPFLTGSPPDNTNLGFNPADFGSFGNRTAKYFNVARSSCDPLNLVFEDLFVNLGVSCNPYSDEYEAFITP